MRDCVVLFLLTLVISGCSATFHDDYPELYRILEYMQDNPSELTSHLQGADWPRDAQSVTQFTQALAAPPEGSYCAKCKTVVAAAKTLMIMYNKYEKLRDTIISTCKSLVNKTQGPDYNVDALCPNTCDLYGDHVWTIVKKGNIESICRSLNACFYVPPDTESEDGYTASHSAVHTVDTAQVEKQYLLHLHKQMRSKREVRSKYQLTDDAGRSVIAYELDEETTETGEVVTSEDADITTRPTITNQTEEETTDIDDVITTEPKVTTSEPDDDSTSAQEAEVIKIIQLADIHVDPHYTVGSPTDCGLPTCCRGGEVYTGNGSANVIGTYQCNTPQRTLHAFLQQVAEMNPDFIIYTGDNPPHAMWDGESLDKQLNCTNLVMGSIRDTLGQYDVYSVIGNHEPYPTNLYYNELDETQALNAELARLWTEAAPISEEQKDNILRGAYYSTHTGVPGLRLLVVNSDFWYTMNFYNSRNEDSEDMRDMQEFIEFALNNATLNGEKVIIAIHHPPGQSDFITRYSQWYNDVIVKYSDVIVLQIAGHTHDDHFKIFRNGDGDPAGVLFVAPSVTPRSGDGGVNPSVRVYTLDKKTHQLINYDQHRIYLTPDLTEMPNMTYVYNAKEMYGLPDMSATSWADLVERISSDENLFQKYLTNFNSEVERGICDVTCQNKHVCGLRYASYEKVVHCIDQLETTTLSPEIMTTDFDNDLTTSGSGRETFGLSALLSFLVIACTAFS